MATRQLPIFPLNVVLLPGTTLPLHLFEPRYRQLLADVRAGDSEFGLLCSISGLPELAIPPGRHGCIAEVTDVEMLPDGRSNILVRGTDRFVLDAFMEHPAPYHVAQVRTVEDLPAANAVALAVLADEVITNFRRIVKAVHVLNDDEAPPPPLPEDPAQLAWNIGAMIDLDYETRYQLLAEREPATRLSLIDGVLRRALPELELRAAMHRR